MELKGLTVNFLGDSITEGAGVKDIENRFDQVLLHVCELKAVHNYGIGGTRIAHQTHVSENPRWDLSFCARALEMNREADLVVVLGGTNDYGHGDAPFGTPEDRIPSTYTGGVHFLMKRLTETYTKAKIVFMTPLRRVGDLAPAVRTEKLPDAKPLLDYAEVIRNAAPLYGISVLDLYHNMGIDPNNPEDCEKYTSDGLHFNDCGHHKIAEALKAFLEQL